MAGGVGAVLPQTLLFIGCQRRLVEHHEGATTHILTLGDGADTVARGRSLEQYLIDLRSLLLADLHAKGLFKLGQDGGQAIDGIALCLGCTLGILTHLLAPVVAGHVIHEGHRCAVGRPGQEFHHVGHLTRGEICIYHTLSVLSKNSRSAADCEDGGKHPKIHRFHVNGFYFLQR